MACLKVCQRVYQSLAAAGCLHLTCVRARVHMENVDKVLQAIFSGAY